MPTYEPSRAARAFAQFLTENDLSDGAAGQLLDVTDVTVYHWRIGLKVPKDVSRKKIRIFTSVVDDAGNEVKPGIPLGDWDDDAEAKELQGIKPFLVVPSATPPKGRRKRHVVAAAPEVAPISTRSPALPRKARASKTKSARPAAA